MNVSSNRITYKQISPAKLKLKKNVGERHWQSGQVKTLHLNKSDE